MNSVLVICYPAKSHFYSILSVLNTLRNKWKSKISVISSSILEDDVKNNGFNFISIEVPPFGVGVEYIIFKEGNAINRFLDNLISRHTFSLYNQRLKAYESIFQTFSKIDLVLLDVMLSNDFIILYKYLHSGRIRFAFFQTTFPFYKRKLFTPPNYFIKDKNLTKVRIHLIWSFFLLRRYFRRNLNRFKYFGRDNYGIVKLLIRFNNIPKKYKCFQNLAFTVGFKDIPELTLVPLELEISEINEFKNCFYFNSKIGKFSNNSRFTNDEIDKFINNSTNLVYCSFGTLKLNNRTKKRALELINAIIRTAKSCDNYQFVISINKFHQLFDAHIDYRNILFCENINQIAILKESKIFITHGGTNSILEAVDVGVPMLVFPNDLCYDQPGNASRIHFFKLGLSIKSNELGSLKKYLEELLYNKTYIENLSKVRNRILNKYQDKELIDYIMNLSSIQ